MIVKQQFKVFAYPSHARFQYPVQAETGITYFLAGSSPINNNNSAGFETNVPADVVHARTMIVPTNNKVYGESDAVPNDWYNTAFGDLVWDKSNQSSRLKFNGDIALTPWVRGTWHRECARSVFYAHAMCNAGAPNTRYDYDPNDSHITLTTRTFRGEALKHQGFYMRLGIVRDPNLELWSGSPGAWVKTVDYPDPADARHNVEIRYKCQDSTGAKTEYVTIWLTPSGYPVFFAHSDPDDPGNPILTMNASKADDHVGSPSAGYFGYYAWGGGETSGTPVKAMLVGGLFEISIGDQVRPSVVPMLGRAGNPLTGSPILFITEVRVIASGIREIGIGATPIMFEQGAVMETSEQSLGITPLNDPITTIRYGNSDQGDSRGNAVTGVTAEVDVVPGVSGPDFQAVGITLTADSAIGTYNGKQYTDRTTFIKAITVVYPEIVYSQMGAPVELHPVTIDVSETFDPTSLEVTRSAVLTFDNYRYMSANHPEAPDVFWGEFMNYAGAFAVEINSRTLLYSDDGQTLLNMTDWNRLFTGHANMRTETIMNEGGKSVHRVTCMDRSIAARDPLFNQPWMDGYNHYYAIAYMANKGGFKRGTVGDTDLAFRQYVPDNPFDDAGDPSGLGSYFLPLGSGGMPLMKPPPGITPWEYMRTIGMKSGFMRYVDRKGYLHYEKYRLQSTPQAYRVFSEVENISEGIVGSPASLVFGGMVSRDLTEVRNHVFVAGLDVFNEKRDVIVSSRIDNGSIYAPGATTAFSFTQGNFLGFKMGACWLDSQFANQAFADAASQDMFINMRVPPVSVSFTTYHQPDLQLGHRIGVNSLRSGLFDRGANALLELMVVSLKHHYEPMGIPTTSIGCRFVPPGSGSLGPF